MKDKRTIFNVELDPELMNKVKRAKTEHGINWSWYVRNSLVQQLEKLDKEKLANHRATAPSSNLNAQ